MPITARPLAHHVVAVSADPEFAERVGRCMADLTGSGPPSSVATSAYVEVLERARGYLRPAAGDIDVRVHLVESFDGLSTTALSAGGERVHLALLVVDARSIGLSASPFDGAIDAELDKLRTRLRGDGIEFEPSPATVFVYGPGLPENVAVGSRYTPRIASEHTGMVEADLVRGLADAVQARSVARFASTEETAIAGALAGFLDRRPGRWGLHYYTGSVVAQVIDDLRDRARAGGNPVLGGPSEHSLACAALARWKLERSPFLIVVTGGMIDEFRGTLSNLRQARAPGIILCAESLHDEWMPFQGTVHDGEDSRAVLRARGIPHVYLDDSSRMADGLAEAFTAYDAGQGPVVVLATRGVLERRDPVEVTAHGSGPVTSGTRAAERGQVDHLVRLLNEEPVRVLCQPGPLDAHQTELMYEIARDAQVALADSITHPGVFAAYRGGCRVPEYLGTLGLYGHSAPVGRYLYSGRKIRDRRQQCLLFVDTPVPAIDTPFNTRAMHRQMRAIQVVHDHEQVAPFSALGVVGDITAVLTDIRDRLDVAPDVLATRREAIRSAAEPAWDLTTEVPVRPMTANQFFRDLGDLLEDMITTDGYTYTGAYDVGRGGLSAMCELPRTGPGFSGWFGRALMGDALQAVPAIALNTDDNVLAFVGDGAAALVPDILPNLVHQVAVRGTPLRGNLSIFRLVNGGHSVIRSYRETQRLSAVSGQTDVLTILEPDQERTFGPLRLRRRHLEDPDALSLRRELSDSATINVYSVLLAHNNEGSGLGLSRRSWWRESSRSATSATPPVTTYPSGELR